MYGECHCHFAMDGVSFAQAMARHKTAPNEEHIRNCFEAYLEAGVAFIRDGGDAYGVCQTAARIAPEYGIEYRHPAFAIHKKGHYGSIVGRGFTNMAEYAQLVNEAEAAGADFIKIMTTGLMDFDCYGRITHEDLQPDEVAEMIRIAHEKGFAVMSHTNGKSAFMAALEAGVDSVEHGNYLDEECVQALSQSRTCLVPTAAVARNLRGQGLYDEDVLARIYEQSLCTIARAVESGCLVAVGSDAGAVCVPHGQGTLDEYACFCEAVPDARVRDAALQRGQDYIIQTFRRH